MTAALAAVVTVCVAVTNATPIAGVIFAVSAAVLSNIKGLRYCTPYAIPLLFALCGLTLPLKSTLIVYTCCLIMTAVKKNYYYPLPILLAVAAVAAITGMRGSACHSLTELALIPLIPCAAGCAPKSKIKSLCIALAVLIPVTFGAGGVLVVCLLLPPVIPVLLWGAKRIKCGGRNEKCL